MKTLIKNGTLVYSDACIQSDIVIDGEKISRIAPHIDADDTTTVIDATGKLVFPGFIDAHTHMKLEAADGYTVDDFVSGGAAALCGGTTTIVDFATQYKGESLHQALAHWQHKAQDCPCDYGFHMAICDWNEKTAQECQDMMDQGITSFKLYLTYANTMVDDATLFEILQRLKEVGGITGVHCENDGMLQALRDEYAQDSSLRAQVSSHYKTHPIEAESEAISRLLHFSQYLDTPVIDVHLTCKQGLDEIRAARQRGQKVYVETCPQYLVMDQSLYDNPDPQEALKYTIAPPLRPKQNQDVLWEALRDGEIQTISTDHCAFTLAQKHLGDGDFRKIPCGMPGVETRVPVIFSEGVAKGRISAEKMCETMCENPAKLYGMYPRKGTLSEGSDADIVIIDPKAEYTISVDTQLSKSDYAPLEGMKCTGKVEKVFLRGQLAAQNGRLESSTTGKFIARDPYNL